MFTAVVVAIAPDEDNLNVFSQLQRIHPWKLRYVKGAWLVTKSVPSGYAGCRHQGELVDPLCIRLSVTRATDKITKYQHPLSDLDNGGLSRTMES